jgi:hypothetical protein
LAGGGVLLGGGIALQFVAASENQTVVSHCQGAACDRIGFEASQRGATIQTLEIVAFSAGAVLSGLGVYLLLSRDKEGGSSKVALSPTKGGALLLLQGSL